MASRSRSPAATILVTGFGPFPGAPFNPTGPLVQRLARLRRPALADVKIVPHIFPTSYAAVDRDLPKLIAKYKPDALLMFGLATRARTLRIETRARNGLALLPDAGGKSLCRTTITPRRPVAIAMPAPAQRLLASIRVTGRTGGAVTRCRALSLQLFVLARGRSFGQIRRSAPCRLCACAQNRPEPTTFKQTAQVCSRRFIPSRSRYPGCGRRPPRMKNI